MVMKECEEEKENYVGRTVKKFFTGFGFFNGKVISFNRARKYYKVKYDDGDREELDLTELKGILVEKDELQVSEKPRMRGGRKRRRDSADKNGSSEAGDPGAKLSAGVKKFDAKPSAGVKKLECNFPREENMEEHRPSWTFERGNSQVDSPILKERGELENDRLLEHLIPVSLVSVFTKLDPLEMPDEASCKKRTADFVSPLDTIPPCRLKRTRVTPSSDACLLQIAGVDPHLKPFEDAELVKNGEAAFVQESEGIDVESMECAVQDRLLNFQDVNGGHLAPTELDNIWHFGKTGRHATQDLQGAKQGSLLFSLPPSSKSLGALDHCVADLFKVYGVLRSFSNVIFLSPFSLEEFVFALRLTDVSSMIDCVHLSLLQTLRRQLERMSKTGSKSATLTLRLADWSLLDYITWPSFLMAYLLTQGFIFPRGQTSLKAVLSAAEYYKLPLGTKLTILSFLCDKVLDTEEARAELGRRAILENDPEVIEAKGDMQKKPENNSSEGEFDDEEKPGLQEISTHSAADCIRVGRHLDEDGNLDECVLCAMDGNLICCDGCPAAYHSRCVGVTRQGLPPGDWFCPECRADKQDQRGARISKGVRGGELLVVGPDGCLFFATCGYLLISELFPGRQPNHRYYSPRDLPKVVKFLEDSAPNYPQLQTVVEELCQLDANNFLAPVSEHKSYPSGFPSSWVSTSENAKHHCEISGDKTQSGGQSPKIESVASPSVANHHYEVSGDKTQSGRKSPNVESFASPSVPVLVAEQTKNLELQLGHKCPKVVIGEGLLDLTSNSPTKDHGHKLELHVCDCLGPTDGLKSDSSPISPINEAHEKVACRRSDKHLKTVEVDETYCNGMDNGSQELERIGKPHDSLPQSPTASTGAQGKEQMSDLAAYLLRPSGSGGISARSVSEQDAFLGFPEIAGEGIATKGISSPGHDTEKDTEANRAYPAKLSPEQQLAGQRYMDACPRQQLDSNKDIDVRNSDRVEDCPSTLTQINACSYSNKYANCDFVATAAFNLAVMAGGLDDLVDDKSGNHRKAKPSSVGDQMKAFTQASAHFFWPSLKKRMMDLPKEKCGWCINCRSTRRGCLLTQIAGQMAGGAAIAVGGIRPLKGGCGHYPAVAAYILFMEENLHGLLLGPWEFSSHRKIWRKRVEQARSLKEVKLSLLEMESSLRHIALSSDWEKIEEDAPESIANCNVILSGTGVLDAKKTPSKKRGRPPTVPKMPAVASYDGACFGVYWWRGGSLSRQIYNWESLPRRAIKRAARRGGFKEIAELQYSRYSDLPRRTRQVAWRTRLDKISSVAQLALEVRYLDSFIKWNDIISPLEASSMRIVKGLAESNRAFREAEIRAKSDKNGKLMYLLGFPENTVDTQGTFASQSESPLKHGSGSNEKPSNRKQQKAAKGEVWTSESDVPLFLLKDFEEKMRANKQSKLPKSLKKCWELTATPQKKSSFWKMLCNPRLAGVLGSKKASSWLCGHCKKSGLESQAVECQRCNGKFHSNCTQVEDSVKGHGEVPVCKSCNNVRLGQRMRKPSYKMLVMQSQLADGTATVQSNDGVVSSSVEITTAGSKRQKKVPRDGHNIARPEKRGRKKKLDLLTPSQSQSEQHTPSKERRTSERIRNSNSPNAVNSLLRSEPQILRPGGRKTGDKVDEQSLLPSSVSHLELTRRRSERQKDLSPAALELTQCDPEAMQTDKQRFLGKRKKLQNVFAGVGMTAQHGNHNDAKQDASHSDAKVENQKRKSGNGLNFGSRSTKSESDIQKFRQEKMFVLAQVGLTPAKDIVCGLCSQSCLPGQLFVGCEYCKEWYHGDAVGLKPGDAEFLIGFKCHKCRKCRAPSCPARENAGVKLRKRGAIDHGEVIDAENVKRSTHVESGGSLQSPWLNSTDRDFLAFSDAKAFPDFVAAATNQAEEALAVDGSNFGHGVLLTQDFGISDLVLSGDAQLGLALGGPEVWAHNASAQLELAALPSQTANTLSFTELLASEDDYFEGVAGSGLGISVDWAAGMYGSENPTPVGLEKDSLPANRSCGTDKDIENNSLVRDSAAGNVNNGEEHDMQATEDIP